MRSMTIAPSSIAGRNPVAAQRAAATPITASPMTANTLRHGRAVARRTIRA